MPKHHMHPKGEGVKLLGKPDELINLLLINNSEKKYVLNQVINEGPKHKQVLSALLLKRLYKLIKDTEKNVGVPFSAQQGYQFSISDEAGEHWLPVVMPVNTGGKSDPQKIADAAAQAPEHELLVYAMCLQLIEWSITLTANVKATAYELK